MLNLLSKIAFIIKIAVVVAPLALLIAGCAPSRTMSKSQTEMPILILEHADGSEDWGRVLFVSGDSLSIRRIEDMQPFAVNADDIVKVYRVERKPPNYLLAFGASTLLLTGSWGIVVGLNGGDTSAGSFLIAGAAGIIPAAMVGMAVSDWTRHYKIIPLNVIGPDGRMNLKLLGHELALFSLQDDHIR